MNESQRTFLHSSDSDEWATPQWLFDALDKEFGFTLDAAATNANHKVSKFYTVQTDGLAADWGNDIVFLNPPYGRGSIYYWMRKAYESSKLGATVVCIVPVRADSRWWHEFAMKGEIRLFRRRLQFSGGKRTDVAPFATAIVVYRPYQYKLTSCAISPVFSGAAIAANDNSANVDRLLALLCLIDRKLPPSQQALCKILNCSEHKLINMVQQLEDRMSNP